jgi:hypothetical protein
MCGGVHTSVDPTERVEVLVFQVSLHPHVADAHLPHLHGQQPEVGPLVGELDYRLDVFPAAVTWWGLNA